MVSEKIKLSNNYYPISIITKQPISILVDKIDKIDLGPIAYKLSSSDEGPLWPETKTKETIKLYRMFLALCGAYPEIPIVPTKDLDEVWHTHVLDTAKYRHDCHKIFGSFLDHFPYLGTRGSEDEKVLHNSFDKTKFLFIQHFNINPLEVSEVKDCSTGTCGASCANTCGCNASSFPSKEEVLRPYLEVL